MFCLALPEGNRLKPGISAERRMLRAEVGGRDVRGRMARRSEVKVDGSCIVWWAANRLEDFGSLQRSARGSGLFTVGP